MRLSTKRDYLSSSQNDLATDDCKRQRTESPIQSLFASLRSPFDCRDDNNDDVPFLSDCDAGVAESLVPGESIPDNEMSFILSFAESREEMQSWIYENENAAWAQSTVQALLSLNVTSSRGSSSSSFLENHRASRRVQFVPGFYTVKEIPHHNSLTADEKRSLYRNKRTLQAEKDEICLEIRFERRLRLCGAADALEEGCFFRNHLGELVHPAHWLVYVNEILPSLPLDTPVVGFSSLNEYKQSDELSKYEQYFGNAMRKRVFHPRSLDL
ncbi:hypothetical protein FisN_9Lu170 [Fistulifera solaris]|uniref:Uncharacterized protein n=1 Tax=Fistulifera solaris TaxID=1519565 RepID=A0A1Z5KKN0_FISSO|nr:hypothetical protein FisN_9Lu170 [Fistulifera solaris]|eukprot:GAX26874.1 hypothetical protein FisN_9Lu170 [Fistulifera solaris]